MALEECVVAKLTGRGELREAKNRIISVTKNKNVRVINDIVVINSKSPVRDAFRLSLLPGVMWGSFGYTAGREEIIKSALMLARTYLKKKRRFCIRIYDEEIYDLKLKIESKILTELEGKSVDEREPEVSFALCRAEDTYSFSVIMYEGVGGSIQTRKRVSTCLVSGGMHSSVLSWLSCLSGNYLRMVHAKVSNESVYSVAMLYESLSRMSDHEMIELNLIEGNSSPENLIYSWLKDNNETAFVGIHQECKTYDFSREIFTAPLLLMPEEDFQLYFGKLRIREYRQRLSSLEGKHVNYSVRRFGNKIASMHEVIDTITST